MKITKIVEFIESKYIPHDLEPGKLYYSPEYEVCCHLCFCGCGVRCCIPIQEGEWSLTNNNGLITIKPSLQQRWECRAHYVITNSEINFC